MPVTYPAPSQAVQFHVTRPVQLNMPAQLTSLSLPQYAEVWVSV